MPGNLLPGPGIFRYASLMTTQTASPELADTVRNALAQVSPGRQAQFADYLADLTPARATAILRQLRCTETDSAPRDVAETPVAATASSTASSHRSDRATEKQANYAADLLRTRVQADERVVGTVKTAAEVLALFAASGQMSRKLARDVIDMYADRPRLTEMIKRIDRPAPAAKAAPVELEAGMYRVGDVVYKVQKAIHGSGRMYAKRLVVHGPGEATFEYDSGAIRKITAEDRMTLEDAQAFGHNYGVCCNCGALLTDPKSIAAGIGPICAKKGIVRY